jgi:hypothetical protein
LATLPVAEHAKVAAVKTQLAQHFDAQASSRAAAGAAAPPLQDPRCLRLRDKKVAAVGSVLRDGASLRRALVPLSDGRQVAVQLLDAPETVAGLLPTRVLLLLLLIPIQ